MQHKERTSAMTIDINLTHSSIVSHRSDNNNVTAIIYFFNYITKLNFKCIMKLTACAKRVATNCPNKHQLVDANDHLFNHANL